MAIAYYIPDQAKLLAGRQPNRQTVNNNRNSNSTSNEAQQSARNSGADTSPAVNRGYGTTINLTVPTYATQQEPSGCWDFLTQVFCHALRFYHESSQLQPTVIQISVNFQSQAAESQATAADTTTAAENTTTSGNSSIVTNATTTTDNANSSNITETTESTATNSPTAATSEKDVKPLKHKKSGKRKN